MLNVSRPSVCLQVVMCVALVVWGRVASAQTTDVVGVRAQGMGGAFTAVADDATASWWNPAGLAGGALFNAIVEYDQPDTALSDSVRGTSVAYPALGLTYYRLPLRQIRLSASTEAAANVRQEDGGVLRLYGATVGQSLGNHLVLASTIKLLQADDTNVTFDVGAMAMFGPVRVGLTVRDLTEPDFGEGSTLFTLERHARLGVAASSGRRGVVGSATVSFDADLTTTHDPAFGDERLMALGGEVWTAKRNLGVRGGVNWHTVGTEPTGVSGGLSFAVHQGTYVDAYLAGGRADARRGWGLALRVTF
jgi:F plasmid transfer operon protein TraF